MEVLAWLSNSDRWRGLVSVIEHEGAGAFVVRTLSGDVPDELTDDATEVTPERHVVPFSARRSPAGDADGRHATWTRWPSAACARSARASSRPEPSCRSRSARTASPR